MAQKTEFKPGEVLAWQRQAEQAYKAYVVARDNAKMLLGSIINFAESTVEDMDSELTSHLPARDYPLVSVYWDATRIHLLIKKDDTYEWVHLTQADVEMM